MENAVEKYRKRRQARLDARKARQDDDWITIKGTHVMVDDDRKITKGPERLRNASGKKAAPAKSEGPSYESFPAAFRVGGRKFASQEDSKKVRDTVTRFMKEAKDGDVYMVGGGIGSAGGQKFKVTTRRGKLALAWISKDGYSRNPVQMSRSNVEEFISNGARRVAE